MHLTLDATTVLARDLVKGALDTNVKRPHPQRERPNDGGREKQRSFEERLTLRPGDAEQDPRRNHVEDGKCSEEEGLDDERNELKDECISER